MMHFQSLFTLSVALLAGTSIAAEQNGGEIPYGLRRGRAKLSASDLLMGSASAVVTPLATPAASTATFPFPHSSSSTSAMKSMRPKSSAAKASSSSFQSSIRPSTPSSSTPSSSAHPSAIHASHAANQPVVTGAADVASAGIGSDDAGLPVSEIADSADTGAKSDAPFWNKPIQETKGKKARPNAPDFSSAPDMQVNSKDACSLRCSNLADQCAELLPHNQDFW